MALPCCELHFLGQMRLSYYQFRQIIAGTMNGCPYDLMTLLYSLPEKFMMASSSSTMQFHGLVTRLISPYSILKKRGIVCLSFYYKMSGNGSDAIRVFKEYNRERPGPQVVLTRQVFY